MFYSVLIELHQCPLLSTVVQVIVPSSPAAKSSSSSSAVSAAVAMDTGTQVAVAGLVHLFAVRCHDRFVVFHTLMIIPSDV